MGELYPKGNFKTGGKSLLSKRYNTPHRTHIIKTRVTEEEHADFMERLTAYGMSQSEFIRQAITGATVKPIIIVSPVNDELLAAFALLHELDRTLGNGFLQVLEYPRQGADIDTPFQCQLLSTAHLGRRNHLHRLGNLRCVAYRLDAAFDVSQACHVVTSGGI